MAVNDLKKAVNSIINERLNSPVIGAFMLSWIVFNWKVIIFLIFETQKNFQGDKIKYIQDHYLTDHWNYLIWPLIFAMLYPIISLIAFSFTELINLLKAKVEFWIQRKKPIDVNQKMDLLKEFDDLKSNYVNQLNEKDEEIKLKSELFANEKSSLLTESNKLNNKLHDLDSPKNKLTRENKELKKSMGDLQNEISKLRDDERKLKIQIDDLRNSESELKRNLTRAESLVPKDKSRKIYNTVDYEDAIMSELDAIKLLSKLGSNTKKQYLDVSIPSESIGDFLTVNNLWESSIK